MVLASLHAITVSRGPKLREKCLNLCPIPPPSSPTPLLFILLFSLASSLSFDARQGGNLTEPGCPPLLKFGNYLRLPIVLVARPPPQKREQLPSLPPPSPLFSPLFIIIRAFYRAPSVQEPTTIKRVGTLCSFDSVVANLLAPLFLSPLHNCFRRLHALIEHPVLAAPAPWETHLSQFQDVSHRVLDEIGISRKEEGKEGYFLSKEFFLFFLSFFG